MKGLDSEGRDMSQSSTKRIVLAHDVVCILIIIGMIGYTFYAMTLMPQTIPIHWTNGVVDGWGSKWMTLLMPGIIVLVYLLAIWFMNYQKRHGESILFVSWVKLGCVILFAVVNVLFIQSAFA